MQTNGQFDMQIMFGNVLCMKILGGKCMQFICQVYFDYIGTFQEIKMSASNPT
jgi:hypothetical protein